MNLILVTLLLVSAVYAGDVQLVQQMLSSLDTLAPSPVACNPPLLPAHLDQESQRIADKHWYAGAPDCQLPTARIPPYEVLRVNAGYFILRQNKCVNFEAPFIYLIIGRDGAIMVDTGASFDASELPLRQWVDSVLPPGMKLTVAHSHAHGDHVAGDNQFANRPNTTVVGLSPEDVAGAFHVNNWPRGIGEFDLGDRKLSVIPIPGHEPSSVAFYDPQSQDLISGDSLYPGNIFLSQGSFGEYKESITRLHDFSTTHPIRNILGAHIEMSREPRKDYEYGSTYHPNEHRLPLYQGNLDEVYNYLQGNPAAEAHQFDDLMLTL